MENYSCIICSKPIDDCGEIVTKGDISVTLCSEHMGSCGGDCERCECRSICVAAVRQHA
jgi:hypothetical protein